MQITGTNHANKILEYSPFSIWNTLQTRSKRRTKNEGSLPFPSTRLRAYSNRIDDLADSYQESEPQVNVETSKTNAPGLSAYPGHSEYGSPEKYAGASNPFPPLEQHSPGAAPPAAVDLNTPVSPQMYNVAIAELHGLRSEISRVEATLQSLKEPQERSTLGRPIYKKNPMRAAPVHHRKDTFAERRKEWESQQLLSATQPVSRGEAVILEQTLEELLPAGVVTKSLKKKGGPSFDVHTFEKQYELVDMVLREAARQVHAGCHERGSVLEKLRMRYNEFFSAMKALLFKLHQNFSNNAADLQVAQTQAQDAVKDRNHLADENIKLKSDCEFLHGRVGALEKDFSQHKVSPVFVISCFLCSCKALKVSRRLLHTSAGFTSTPYITSSLASMPCSLPLSNPFA
ncbi:hypothetical protein CYMTET_29087 [Cymbomonas tetramitiformis]|uniref:Uncharacterized protein n=1 Tax=Cymbomonas tetramitiformis TaxID=36881 RepID=A0AAE0KV96_9CHLO|nr:hypothetical protein CYMTET_29087 [Cymbomonas tetramitiformis]